MEQWRGNNPVVAYDRSGAGSSPVPDRPYTLADHATELEALRADLGLERIVTVGNAIGALIAALPRGATPNRVAGLVLCDPAVVRAAATSAMLEERIAKVTAGGMAAILPDAVDRAFHGHAHDERYRAYLERFGAQDPRGYVHSMRSSSGADLAEAYRAITCPALVLVGENDLLFPPAQAERVVDLLADVELVVLDGVAHFPPYQDPDRVASLVADFVTRRVC